MAKTGIKSKAALLISNAKQYWHTPAEGNYVPYKEIAALSGGGIGVHWATTLSSYIGLDAANFLIGSTLKLDPVHLSVMLIIANILGMPFGAFRGWLFDNHRFKSGKFIPFLLHTPLPIVLLSTAFVWLPFEGMGYWTKVVVTEIFFFVISNFVSYYTDSFAYIQQIISPNAQERVNILSVAQIIYSIAPTITNLVIPTVAALTFGLDNIWTYRIIYPAFTFVGLIFSCICFRKVKERLVVPKSRRQHVRTLDALREISKNKYYWIINGATWVGFLEGAYNAILGWTFLYAYNGEKQVYYGTAITIISNSALWAMLLAPVVIKFFGKRNLLIICNVLNIIVFTAMYFTFRNVIILCALLFINGFINTFGNIYFPAINADMRDYHQWKTGVRVDGMFTTMGLIGTVIGFGTGLVVPYIYRLNGVGEEKSVLLDDMIREPLFETLIIATIIGAALNLIPYLFYDLTETKHKGYVKVLKIRAMFEDYAGGEINTQQLSEAIGIINTAREHHGKEKLKAEKGASKQERERIRFYNENVENAPIVIEEIGKFETERYIRQLERAEEIADNCGVHIYAHAEEKLAAAKNMSKNTAAEKELRLDAIKDYRLQVAANKLIEKYGAENILPPDEKLKNELETRETKGLAEHLRASKQLRQYSKRVSVYNRAVEPYTRAASLVKQKHAFAMLEEIEASL